MRKLSKKYAKTVITSIEFKDILGIEATQFDEFIAILAAMDDNVKLESNNFTVRKAGTMLHVASKLNQQEFTKILTNSESLDYVNIKNNN